MISQLKLSKEEWDLLSELVERELDELPIEIHHCRVSGYRDSLRQRQDIAQGLLVRLHDPFSYPSPAGGVGEEKRNLHG
jgi:hypothetical protein